MLNKETLLKIKNLLEIYRDENISKVSYYENICPIWEEATSCSNLIEKIENYLYDLKNP